MNEHTFSKAHIAVTLSDVSVHVPAKYTALTNIDQAFEKHICA